MKALVRSNTLSAAALAGALILSVGGCKKDPAKTAAPNKPLFAKGISANEPAPPLEPLASNDAGAALPYDQFGEPLPPLPGENAGAMNGAGGGGFGGADNIALASMVDPAMGGTGIPQSDAMRVGAAGMITDLQTVYFAYNSAELSPDGMATLDANAGWINSNINVHIQIEGHCDERGTIEYNLNLGQMRADMVREYLATVWQIDPARLHTISYGEERPVGSDDSKNRRVQFLVYDPNV